jgi:hypothetical protein
LPHSSWSNVQTEGLVEFDCGSLPGWKTGAPGRIFCKMNNSVAVAVVAGAIIIAATMAVIFRYEVSPISVSSAYRFDRWTGKMQICTYQKVRVECSNDKPPQTP